MNFLKYRPGLIALLLMLPLLAVSQDKDPEKILEAVRQKFKIVKDYEAQVTIKVDVDFIKIPLKKGTIWFLEPDKVKVKTPGFALLPKRGMNFSPTQLFSGDYATIYAREEKVGNFMTSVIKVIPQNDDDEIILSTLWIDTDRNVIRKLETTTKKEGTFSMLFNFGNSVKKYDLPDEIVFNFDLRKNELPIGLTGDFENTEPKTRASGNSRGTVTINYLNYEINEGKAAAIFNQKTE